MFVLWNYHRSTIQLMWFKTLRSVAQTRALNAAGMTYITHHLKLTQMSQMYLVNDSSIKLYQGEKYHNIYYTRTILQRVLFRVEPLRGVLSGYGWYNMSLQTLDFGRIQPLYKLAMIWSKVGQTTLHCTSKTTCVLDAHMAPSHLSSSFFCFLHTTVQFFLRMI